MVVLGFVNADDMVHMKWICYKKTSIFAMSKANGVRPARIMLGNVFLTSNRETAPSTAWVR